MAKRKIEDLRDSDCIHCPTVCAVEEEKQSDTVEVVNEVSRPGPFRTGDVVEMSDDGENWYSREFIGYMTNGRFMAYDHERSRHTWYGLCRFTQKPKKHTITCSDEVFEKVKQIEGVVVE